MSVTIIYGNERCRVPREPGTNKLMYDTQVTLTFKRSELLYDARNMAYVEGDIIPTADEHDRHQIVDIGEDGNADRVARVIGLIMAEVRELLFPYTKTPIGTHEQEDDALETPEKYVVEMKVPRDFSETTIDLMEKYIHEYIVCRVLQDWMSITNLKNPNSATTWQMKAQEAKEQIASTLNAKRYRVRRTLTPF